MQLELVNFVIESHRDLASLAAAVQTETLEYITVSAPNFAKHLSQMHPQAIYIILSKMPFPCQYIQSLEYDIAEAIVLKVPQLSRCGLPMTTTTPAPVTTTTTTTTTQTTVEAVNVVPIAQTGDVESMFIVYPEFMDLFNHLGEEFIAFLKTFNPKHMDSRALGEMFMVMADEDVPMQMFAKLFVQDIWSPR
ncbi:hypothetical protein Aperf_G00000001406 [Anoplocephala perfoliata]